MGRVKKEVPRMHAGEIFRALKRHYGNGAELIAEVGDQTGHGERRRLDAIALGTWPSRGLFLHGIEIKISRSDLDREIREPEKADAFAPHVDSFWIATPAGLCTADELPPAWGLYHVRADGTVRTVRAAKQGDCDGAVERGFLASLVRGVVQQRGMQSQIERAKREHEIAIRRSMDEATEKAKATIDVQENELRDLRGKLRAYENLAAGYRLGEGDIIRLGRILRNLSGDFGSLNSVRENARNILRDADELESIARRMLAEDGAA